MSEVYEVDRHDRHKIGLRKARETLIDLPAIEMIDMEMAIEVYTAFSGKGWRPIESAPKDGTAVLCYSSMTGPYNSSWDKHLQTFPCGYWGFTGEWFPVATHWMPLPEPPSLD